MTNDKDYIFYESTLSFCNVCQKQVQSKIILKDNKVYIVKECSEHGKTQTLLEEDINYFVKKKEYDKPGTNCKTQTKINKGCPFDCGVCPSHEQHTCIGLIEITNKCNLKCPLCYANSGEDKSLDIKQINNMMDFYQTSEFGKAETLQISGGEPTIHPQILDILKLAKSKDFKYVMLNTNGLIIANNENFCEELSKIFDKGGFEIYLQFDGFKDNIYKHFRGNQNLFEIKKKAIKNLQKYNIPITLVMTVQKYINDDEIGKVIDFAINEKCIRGVNIQPVSYFGRLPEYEIKSFENRITLTGVLKKIEEQTKNYDTKLKFTDFVPLPCNVHRVAITYLFKEKKKFIPITRKIDVRKYLSYVDNSLTYSVDDFVNKTKKPQETSNNNTNITQVCDCMKFIKKLKPIAPLKLALKSKQEKIDYVNENVFRITITSFVDVYNFDLQAMKKECVHVITPDLKKIPFSAYNMFHRR